MGVPPSTTSSLGWKDSAETKSCRTFTGPKVMMAISTRLAASASPASSFWNCLSPALSWAIGSPDMEPELSSSSTHAQRGSGLSTKVTSANGTWVSCVIGGKPQRVRKRTADAETRLHPGQLTTETSVVAAGAGDTPKVVQHL